MSPEMFSKDVSQLRWVGGRTKEERDDGGLNELLWAAEQLITFFWALASVT